MSIKTSESARRGILSVACHPVPNQWGSSEHHNMARQSEKPPGRRLGVIDLLAAVAQLLWESLHAISDACSCSASGRAKISLILKLLRMEKGRKADVKPTNLPDRQAGHLEATAMH